MKKRPKLQAAILAALASSSYADDKDDNCFDYNKSLPKVLECFQNRLDTQQKQIQALKKQLEQLSPKIYMTDFDNSTVLTDFIYKETLSSCVLKGVTEGVVLYCPDNGDNVLILKRVKPDGSEGIRIETEVSTWKWNDRAPRVGIDFGFDSVDSVGVWGPNPGYAFYFSDPYDPLQGKRCSHDDKCPSITIRKSGVPAILELANVGTSPDVTYRLVVDMDRTGITFTVESNGSQIAYMHSDDTSYRTGFIGLHCSEGWCRFDKLKVTLY